MTALPKFTHWSTLQRLGAFVTVGAILFIVLLHFPFAGYQYEHEVVTHYAPEPCKEPASLEELHNMSLEEINCRNTTELQIAPISEWRSNRPVIDWFGSVLNTSVCICLLLIAGFAWLRLFHVAKAS